MRVVHIITRLILGGAQENTVLTVEGLHHRHRDEVVLITGPAIGPEGDLFDRVHRAKLNVVVVPQLRRAIRPDRDLAAWWRLYRLLREIRPEIVHTHSSKAGILGRSAAYWAGVPVIIHTIHGLPFHSYERAWRNQIYMWQERRAARHTTAIISVSDAMTEQAVAAGVAPREKFSTIYSGMEVEEFLKPRPNRAELRRELGYNERHVVIGKVARLFELKGHEYVIAAARKVIDQHPEARFLLVGDGILQDSLRDKIHRLGLTPYFQFTGLVPPGRIPELLAAMDIVVHASLREGLARVLPQALISARPVVSYDIDGAREVVLPGKTGFLLPPQSVDEMAAALNELIEKPELRERMGRLGRELFTEPFDHQRMVDALRDLYLACLHRPQPTPVLQPAAGLGGAAHA